MGTTDSFDSPASGVIAGGDTIPIMSSITSRAATATLTQFKTFFNTSGGAKYTLNEGVGATVAAAGDLTGATITVAEYTLIGTSTLTTRTAALMFTDTPSAQAGDVYMLRIMNSGVGTVTLTAGVGVTLIGTATIATVSARSFLVTFTSATAATIRNVGEHLL